MPSQKTDPKTIQKEKQLIKDVVGLSGIEEISLNDRGWDSRVYSFKGHYFFKFPRSEKIQNRYEYEIAAIKFIANMDTDIVAQKILWQHPQNVYFGYEGVQGEPVSNIIEKLSAGQKRVIGETLGDFLKHFHQLELSGARTMSIEDESKQIQQWYENCKPTVKEHFTSSEQQKLHALVYEEWPSRLIELGSELVLCHGDLHFENILYGNNGEVGIIDFGDVAYFDRSKDFLELEEDEEIFKAVLGSYGNPGQNLKQKIAVRQAMIQIINLGFHIGKGDEAKIALTAKKIKADL